MELKKKKEWERLHGLGGWGWVGGGWGETGETEEGIFIAYGRAKGNRGPKSSIFHYFFKGCWKFQEVYESFQNTLKVLRVLITIARKWRGGWPWVAFNIPVGLMYYPAPPAAALYSYFNTLYFNSIVELMPLNTTHSFFCAFLLLMLYNLWFSFQTHYTTTPSLLFVFWFFHLNCFIQVAPHIYII